MHFGSKCLLDFGNNSLAVFTSYHFYCDGALLSLHRDGTSIVLSDDVGQIYLLNTGQGESQKDAKYDQVPEMSVAYLLFIFTV